MSQFNLRFLILLLLIPCVCSAAEVDIFKNIIIQSDVMESSLQNNSTYLQGNVRVINDILSINAEMLEIIFLKKNSMNLQNIKKINITSGKHLIRASAKWRNKKYTLHCKKLILDMQQDKIVILNATVNDGNNTIVGEKIIYDISKDIFLITGNTNERVKVVINTDVS